MSPDDIPQAATLEDRKRNTDCMFERFSASFPGGPAELARAGDQKAVAAALEAAKQCAHEFSTWVYSRDEWIASFKTQFTNDCVLTDGPALRQWCVCLAEQAPKHFESPRAFSDVAFTTERDTESGVTMAMLYGGCNHLRSVSEP